jgi:hypothetical protein
MMMFLSQIVVLASLVGVSFTLLGCVGAEEDG